MSRAEMNFGQIAKILLGVAVALVLFSLMIRIFSPVFNRDDEVAKSYFETLKDEIDIARDGGKGEFFMWNLGNEIEYYIVYFGDSIEASFKKVVVKSPRYTGLESSGLHDSGIETYDVEFNTFGRESNRICICSVEGIDSICSYCEDLDYPAVLKPYKLGDESATWIRESGLRTGIELEEGEYVFSDI